VKAGGGGDAARPHHPSRLRSFGAAMIAARILRTASKLRRVPK
jgi:hypothetical protein